MARIIFGVQGEGLGHAMRSAILISHLQKNHQVKVFAGNRAYDYLSGKFKDVNEIESQNILYKNNKAVVLGTILLNIKKGKKFVVSYNKIRKAIKDFNPDVIISDFELLTHLAARSCNAKHISIDNQNDLTYKKTKPKADELVSFMNARNITRFFSSGADIYLIYSLRPGRDSKNRKYLGNLIKDKVRAEKPRYGNHVFVYQTSDSHGDLLKIFKKIDEKFIIYGFNKKSKDKNLVFRKFNDTIYHKDFSQAKALIVGGGLTTITEAIYMKKPILSIPIKGQFEQTYNARTIEELGFGKYLKDVTKEDIEEFLVNLTMYRKNLRKYKGMSNEQIFKKIDSILSG